MIRDVTHQSKDLGSGRLGAPAAPPSYSPHLDGLRCVAVYLVVAFHAGLGVFASGFIGVDVFFVLSGFLVTRILLADLVSAGRISWVRFYSRRARRILPAAVITLAVTSLAYAAVATPAQMLDSLDGFRAAFLYFANWHFIAQSTDYFAADVDTNPVLHFWSLAIEEQFYVLWPMVLTAAYLLTRRLGRWHWWSLRGLVAASAVASAVAALRLGATDVTRAYYGTDTRVYQLLAGALLALTPQFLTLGNHHRRLVPAAAWASLGGVTLLATSAIDLGAIPRGIIAVTLTALLIASLGSSSPTRARRVLSLAPLTYLGRISYGTYLWHWPVVVIVTHEWSPNPTALFAVSCGLATTLAVVSFHLLEHPIRSSPRIDRHRLPVIALGVAASVTGGVLLAPVILERHATDPAGLLESADGAGNGPRLLDWRVARNDIPDLPDCLDTDVERCTVVNGTGLHVLLMGDSAARMWIPTFTEIARSESLTLSVTAFPVCPWQRGILVPLKNQASACSRHQDDWYERVVPGLDPDIIVLADTGYDDPAKPAPLFAPDGGWLAVGSPGLSLAVRDASTSSLHALRRPDRRILIIEPIPSSSHRSDPLSCLSDGRSSDACAYRASAGPTPIEKYLRATSHPPDVVVLDLDRLVCPRLPECDAVLNAVIVKRDESHLTATFARTLAGPVAELLKTNGLLSSDPD